jgi:hypothetical protein
VPPFQNPIIPLNPLGLTNRSEDQQIAQLYELMQAIRKRDLEENDPEYEPDK